MDGKEEKMYLIIWLVLENILIPAYTIGSFPGTIKVGHVFCEVRQEQAAIAFNESLKRMKMDGIVQAAMNFV